MTELKFIGIHITEGFPGGSDHKESSCNVEDPGLISRLERPPGLEIPTPVFLCGESMDRGAWQATVHRATKSWTQLQ